MSFGNPVFLIGLALIPVLLVLYINSERRPPSLAPALACVVLGFLATACVGTNGKPTNTGVVAGEVAANVAMAAAATAVEGAPHTGGDHAKAIPDMTSCERQRENSMSTGSRGGSRPSASAAVRAAAAFAT